jgi:hypothetical protein
MIRYIKKLFNTLQGLAKCPLYMRIVDNLAIRVFESRREMKSLRSRVIMLEQQQEIMHNFLIQINTYLAKQTENTNG